MIVDPGQLEMGSAVMNRLGDMGQHLDDPAADARSEALLTIPAVRTFLAPPDGHPRPDQRPRILPRPDRGTGPDPHDLHRDGIDWDRGCPAADRDQRRRPPRPVAEFFHQYRAEFT